MKITIMNIAGKTRQFLKDALSIEKKRYYAALFILSFIVFVFILFPYENYLLKKINTAKTSGLRSISVSDADISLFGKKILNGIDLVFPNGSRLEISSLASDVSLFKLFLKKQLDSEFKLSSFNYKNGNTEITGALNSECNFKLGDKYVPVAGEIALAGENLIFKRISLKGSLQGFEFEKFNIKSINAKINFENSNIIIKDFIFSGKDLSGKIKGSVRLNQNFRNSVLNLTIEISAASTLLKDFEMFLNQYIDPETNLIRIELTGTVSVPSVNPKRAN